MQHLISLAYMVVGAFLFWLGYFTALPVRKPAIPVVKPKKTFRFTKERVEAKPKILTEDEEKANKFYS